MSEPPSVLLQRAAELIERRADSVLAKDWVWDEDIYRVMSRVHAGDVAICSTDFPEGQWIAMANPLWSAPLVAWLRKSAAHYDTLLDMAEGDVSWMEEWHTSPVFELARLILGEPRKD